MIQTGLEQFLADSNKYFEEDSRVGYLSNHASTTRNFIHGRMALQQVLGTRLTTLFSPQHGFFAEKQDNMIESDHDVDEQTSLPLYSLYGRERKPTAAMLENLDVLVIDLVDVGTRVYTFIHTMAYCMEAAAEQGKKIIVFDRPNPIGGLEVEGNILQPDCTSFVGLYPIPMRHGMTIGEMALLINEGCGTEDTIGCELEIVPVYGWQRKMLMAESGALWLAPSPNMPTPTTALVYPGQVIWEGTTVSEGRGTTLPFELVGAPYWRHDEILDCLGKTELPGCFLRPVLFAPTSGKYAGENCTGFQIHITDSTEFKPYRTSLALLQAAIRLYPDDFQYKKPPYEYEFERLPIDLILGDQDLRKNLEEGMDILELEQEWQKELESFKQLRKEYLLYK